jgi:hypothetical protein
MSLQHFFRSDSGEVIEITDHVRLYEFETTMQAEEGSHGSSMVPVDDPDAELTIGGHRLFYSMESTATGSNQVAYVGYTADRDVHRGPYQTDVGRVWDVNLVDVNSVLARRILTGSTANRPAETDVARMQWLFGTEEADIIDNITEFFDATGGVAMDAVDYRGQTVEDVANDCANASGKNYFVTNIGTFAGNFYLWYGFADSELYTSPIRLSNYLPDLDDPLTFAISDDTKLNRDPSRVYSGVYLPYDAGANAAVYVQSIATANAFALKGRDVQMDGRNIKTAAKATARATRYLGDLDTEEDRITTSFQIPAAQQGFIREGMRVQFRGTHLPGYSTFQWLRVLKRTLKQDSELTFWVTLELSTGDGEAAAPAPGSSAFAILYSPDNNMDPVGNIGPDVLWGGTGDLPPSGQPAIPKTGLLDYHYDSPQRSTVYIYDGIEATGTGNLTINFHTTASHAVDGSVTTTFSVLLNGTPQLGDVQSSSGSLRFEAYEVDINGVIAVVPGDVISCSVSTTWGGGVTVPWGSGDLDNHLTVEGTLA